MVVGMRLLSRGTSRWITISNVVPASSFTSFPRVNIAIAVPIAHQTPAPTNAPLPPLLSPPTTAPVPAELATVPIFSHFWLSERIVPSSSFTEVLSTPGAFSTAPGRSTV